MVDILRIRRASVGLIVLAPNPFACAGITDILRLLLAFAPGVPGCPGVPLRPKRLGLEGLPVEEVHGASGVLDGVNSSFEMFVPGSSIDFAFRALGDGIGFESSLRSSFPSMRIDIVSFCFSILAFLVPTLGLRCGLEFSAASGGRKVPGPTDFLGALIGPLLKELGGKWLCLRPRSIDVVVLDIGSGFKADLPTAFEFFRPSDNAVMFFFVLAAGTADGGTPASALFSGAFETLPRPGTGKWLRLGSVEVMLVWKSSKLRGVRKASKSRESFFSRGGGGFCGAKDAKLNREISLMDNSCVYGSWDATAEAPLMELS